MIKVNYDSLTGVILGYYPDDIDYVSIPEPNIEIDDNAHQDCINNQGNRIVDIRNKVIITGTIDKILTEVEQLTNLDATYQPQFDDLVRSLGLATLANDTTKITDLQSEYAVLKTAYTTARSAIENGQMFRMRI